MTEHDDDYEDAPFTVTLKGHKGYDAPWLVVRGKTAAETVARLAEAGIDGLIDKIAEYSTALQNRFGAGSPSEQTSTPSGSSGAQSNSNSSSGSASNQQSNNNSGGTSRHGARLHPEGVTCQHNGCANVLEYKETGSGKKKWQCPDWRYNNGNPNGHKVDWINS